MDDTPAPPDRVVDSAEPARRFAAWAFIVAYLATTALFLVRHAQGDTGGSPLAYFFTWDMFPSYATQSSRRVAVGQTASGKYLQLHPSALDQYRGGVLGDVTHVELDRRGFFYRRAIERTIARTAGEQAGDPIRHVFLGEAWWPVKYNYPPELYERWAGTPRRPRRYWRTVGEFDVTPPQHDDSARRPAGEGP